MSDMDVTVVAGRHHHPGRGRGRQRRQQPDARRRRRRRRDPPRGRSGGARGLHRRRFPDGLATGDAGWTTRGGDAGALGDPRGRAELRRRPARPVAADSCYSRALAVADELGRRVRRVPAGVAPGSTAGPRPTPSRPPSTTLRSTPTPVAEARMVAFDRGDVRRDLAAAARWLSVGTSRPVFVLHDHRKPAPHFDLRLEEDGVLKSWAVPRGMPTDSRHDRLAVPGRRPRPRPRDVHRRAQGHRRHRLVGARGPHRQAVRVRAPRPRRRPPLRHDHHRPRHPTGCSTW